VLQCLGDTHAQLTYWVKLLAHIISLQLPGVFPDYRHAKRMVQQALQDFAPSPASTNSSGHSDDTKSSSTLSASVAATAPASGTDGPIGSINTVPPVDIIHSTHVTIDADAPLKSGKGRYKYKRAMKTGSTPKLGQGEKVKTTKVDITPSRAPYTQRIGEAHASHEWQSLMHNMDHLHQQLSLLGSFPSPSKVSLSPPVAPSKSTKSFKGASATTSSSSTAQWSDALQQRALLQLSCIRWLLANEWVVLREQITNYVNIYSDMPVSISLYQVEHAIQSLLTGTSLCLKVCITLY
jgi:hypothetical protein